MEMCMPYIHRFSRKSYFVAFEQVDKDVDIKRQTMIYGGFSIHTALTHPSIVLSVWFIRAPPFSISSWQLER